MSVCLLIQPIHQKGIQLLMDAGLEVRQASSAAMDVVAKEIVPAVAAITRNAGLNRQAMEAAANLKVLGNHGIGVDPVDVKYATEIGLPIVFTPYGNVQSVAEHTVSQMLAIAKRTREADRAVRKGNYDYRYSGGFRELFEKTLAVIGFGRTGRRTAEIAKAAFSMRVIAYDPYVDKSEINSLGMEKWDSLEQVLAAADVVSLHLQLTRETRNLMNRERIFGMKKGAMLVNTARGALVEAEALIDALKNGHLCGAAMDVFEKEPLSPDHPYTEVDNLVLSPHIAGATEESLQRTAIQTATQVIEVLEGKKPMHLVNPEVWDRRRFSQ
ncbi:MAG: hydroxyacid dehydrogenase [Deltaproteobacteria bacterium]|nr:hydroxyacid dehydrogenase [Deltaproteobacteria bacterium]